MQGRDIYADLEKIEARGKRKKKKDKGFLSFGLKKGGVQTEEPVAEPEPTPDIAYQPERPDTQEQPGPGERSGFPRQVVAQDREAPAKTEPEITLVESASTPGSEQPEQSGSAPAYDLAPQIPEPQEDEEVESEGEGVVLAMEPASSPAPPRPSPPMSPVPAVTSPPAPKPPPPAQDFQPIVEEQEPVQRSDSIEEGPEPAPESTRDIPSEPEPEEAWKPLSGKELARAEEHLTAFKRWLNQGFKAGLVTREQCHEMTQDKEVELGLRPPE